MPLDADVDWDAALRTARLRELFMWQTAAAVPASVGAAAASRWSNNRTWLVVLPLCAMSSLYLWDAGFGTKDERVRRTAQQIEEQHADTIPVPARAAA
jgi:hypothetical protein